MLQQTNWYFSWKKYTHFYRKAGISQSQTKKNQVLQFGIPTNLFS